MKYIDDILEQEYLLMLGLKYNKTLKEDILFIFFMRTFIILGFSDYNKIENIKSEEIANILHKELKLDDIFLYKEIVVKKISYDIGNSSLNIIDNWRYEYLNQHLILKNIVCDDKINSTLHIIKLLLNKYFIEAERILRKFPKKTPYRKEKIIYILLQIFMNDFNFQTNIVPANPKISYFMFNNKTEIDDMYKEHSEDFDNIIKYDLEMHVENYIIQNFKVIFPFLERIERQFVIQDNRIDILGISNDTIYIFEIKNVNKPKDLIFQLQNYKNKIKIKFPDKKIVAVSITPKLNNDYIIQLKNIGAQIYFFKKENNQYIFEEQK